MYVCVCVLQAMCGISHSIECLDRYACYLREFYTRIAG